MYKHFLFESYPVDVLGSLHQEMGDELRAFKQSRITYPHQIVEAFKSQITHFDCDAVTYIPSNKANVMKFFAQECASLLGVSVWDGLMFTHSIAEQKHLVSREERKANVVNAFELKNHPKFSKIMLIDDVFASGETLREVLKLFEHHHISLSHILMFTIRENF